MLSKQHILDLIAEEKNKYSAYLQLCTYYKIEPDLIALAKCSIKTETLEYMLKSM
jgi:hypothetical protein